MYQHKINDCFKRFKKKGKFGVNYWQTVRENAKASFFVCWPKQLQTCIINYKPNILFTTSVCAAEKYALSTLLSPCLETAPQSGVELCPGKIPILWTCFLVW
jgi:hypothetical protein